MTYAFGWTGLVIISLWISLFAFVWAVRNGQFAEQQRLRFLPLRGENMQAQSSVPPRRPIEVLVLAGICGIVFTVFFVAVLLSLVMV